MRVFGIILRQHEDILESFVNENISCFKANEGKKVDEKDFM